MEINTFIVVNEKASWLYYCIYVIWGLPLLPAQYKWLITKGQWLAQCAFPQVKLEWSWSSLPVDWLIIYKSFSQRKEVPVFEEISQFLWTIYHSYQIRVSKIFINQLAIHAAIISWHSPFIKRRFLETQNKLTSNPW